MTTLVDQTASSRPAAAGSGEARGFSPALIAAALYTLLTLALVLISYLLCARHFVYPLDDTYIGMAIAKNFALHGVWGVTRYEFTSADSSLLFPLLLAGLYRIFGVNAIAPIALSWTFGLASIFVAARMLAGRVERRVQIVALILLVLFTPLFVIGLLGMEHSLHLLLTLLFLGYFLEEPAAGQPQRLATLALVTTLMVATRYEGLFVVASACVIFALQRRWKAAATILVASALPVAAYAAYSVSHGAGWLPNSVSLKGAESHHGSLLAAAERVFQRVAWNTGEGIHLPLFLLGIGLAAAILARRSPRSSAPLAIVFLGGCLHLCLAAVGWLFRYEDYLLGAGIVALAAAWPALMEQRRRPAFVAAYLALVCAALSLSLRSVAAFHLLPGCSRSIYSQQWQMAHFLGASYPETAVAANDIGAIDYFNDIHCFDLIGLANADIFRARRAGRYSTALLDQETRAHHVRIAILYDDWFGGARTNSLNGGPPLPATWIRVGQWTYPPAILVEKTVSFYAVDPVEAAKLRTALQQFDPNLPKAVIATVE